MHAMFKVWFAESIFYRLLLFRMVGGVLVERTVQEVLPALVGNRDKMGNFSTFSNFSASDFVKCNGTK